MNTHIKRFIENYILILYLTTLIILGIIFYKINLFWQFLGFFVAIGLVTLIALGIIMINSPIDEGDSN